MQYHAIPCNTIQYHAIPCNTMQYQYHALPCNTMQYHAIPCNTMQYYAMQCNTMQYHASLITADGAYHCPVGSIWLFFTLGLQSRLILISRSKPKPTISRNQHNLKYDVLELSHLTMLLIYISYSLELLSPLVGWFNRHEKSAHRWPAALGWQQHSQRQHGRCNIIDLNEGPPTRNQGGANDF